MKLATVHFYHLTSVSHVLNGVVCAFPLLIPYLPHHFLFPFSATSDLSRLPLVFLRTSGASTLPERPRSDWEKWVIKTGRELQVIGQNGALVGGRRRRRTR